MSAICFICIQAHPSQHGWHPPAVPGFWQPDTTGEITPHDLFDITKRGANGFRCANWYNRSFCDMQDDGGQSKVLFFEGVACQISNFLVDDNLGLLYGMGHAGLIMIGNSFDNYDDNDYTIYTSQLGNGFSFGEAYRDYANRDFDAANDNFILFGAGTLKAFSC